jgi:hypothetical protein
MKKKKYNPYAKALASTKFKLRKVASKKIYNRKKKEKLDRTGVIYD